MLGTRRGVLGNAVTKLAPTNQGRGRGERARRPFARPALGLFRRHLAASPCRAGAIPSWPCRQVPCPLAHEAVVLAPTRARASQCCSLHWPPSWAPPWQLSSSQHSTYRVVSGVHPPGRQQQLRAPGIVRRQAMICSSAIMPAATTTDEESGTGGTGRRLSRPRQSLNRSRCRRRRHREQVETRGTNKPATTTAARRCSPPMVWSLVTRGAA